MHSIKGEDPLSEFVRLNPEADARAYVRRLVDEESSTLHTLSARVAATGNARVASSEAVVRQYLAESFEPTDWLAIVARNHETGVTIQRITTAQKIATHEFQAWLRHQNAHGFDIYVSLNTFKDHARGRTKAEVKEIRHLYLDLDKDGQRKLADIQNDPDVPSPNFVLNTSPGKYQVIWRVRGINQSQAEAALRGLVQRLGGDPAATDSTRVFRLPGFSNKKYDQDFEVRLTSSADAARVYQISDFRFTTLELQPRPISPVTGVALKVRVRPENSQSERDWAYAIRHLQQGDDPQEIIRDMALYRSMDRYDPRDPTKLVALRKPDPVYYAERTVAKAMVHLGITRPSAEPSPAQSGAGSSEIDHSR